MDALVIFLFFLFSFFNVSNSLISKKDRTDIIMGNDGMFFREQNNKRMSKLVMNNGKLVLVEGPKPLIRAKSNIVFNGRKDCLSPSGCFNDRAGLNLPRLTDIFQLTNLFNRPRAQNYYTSVNDKSSKSNQLYNNDNKNKNNNNNNNNNNSLNSSHRNQFSKKSEAKIKNIMPMKSSKELKKCERVYPESQMNRYKSMSSKQKYECPKRNNAKSTKQRENEENEEEPLKKSKKIKKKSKKSKQKEQETEEEGTNEEEIEEQNQRKIPIGEVASKHKSYLQEQEQEQEEQEDTDEDKKKRKYKEIDIDAIRKLFEDREVTILSPDQLELLLKTRSEQNYPINIDEEDQDQNQDFTPNQYNLPENKLLLNIASNEDLSLLDNRDQNDHTSNQEEIDLSLIRSSLLNQQDEPFISNTLPFNLKE